MADEQTKPHATPRGWLDGKNFSENRGAHCPACRSQAVTYTGDYTSDAFHLRRQAACTTCGEQWHALWRMIGYDPAPIASAATAVRIDVTVPKPGTPVVEPTNEPC